MQYKLIRSNRKTIAIIIRDKQVIVRAPYDTPLSMIEAFVFEKKNWIYSKLEESFVPGIDYQSGSILLFGKNYKLQVRKGKQFNIKIENDVIVETTTYSTLNKKIEDSLKPLLFNVIDSYVTYYASLLNIKKPPFIIRRYKRIYGRCNQQHELAFNLYLFHQDLRFVEYVVLHECAHILEFNHSANFYNIIKQFMPDYKDVIKLAK